MACYYKKLTLKMINAVFWGHGSFIYKRFIKKHWKKIGVLLLPYLRNSFYQLTAWNYIGVFLIYDKNHLPLGYLSLSVTNYHNLQKFYFHFDHNALHDIVNLCRSSCYIRCLIFPRPMASEFFFLCMLIQRNFKDIVKILCIISICTSYKTHLVALVFVILFNIIYI